jgi:hypothetical protein
MPEPLLFSGRSIWTMVHGIVLGGGALMGLAAALFALGAMRASGVSVEAAEVQARPLRWLLVFVATTLWLTVLVGTYVSFPAYRLTPPEGVVDLSRYPRSLIQSNVRTAWLHSFAMEIKEHVPWIAAMLSTAVAWVALRYRVQFVSERYLRRTAMAMLSICFVIVASVSLLGVFINKVAPLE